MPEFPVEPRSLTAAATLLKAMAHPVRLCLVAGLVRNGGCIVREMQHCLGVPQATISQHLARLRAAGVVTASRAGAQVRYEVGSALARQVVEAVLGQVARGQGDRGTGGQGDGEKRSRGAEETRDS